MDKKYYNRLGDYLLDTFCEKVKKIPIDGGFTCPNRDGKCGWGGCIFCGEKGSGEQTFGWLSIEKQIEKFFSTPKRLKGFIAYFQNFTNTYAPPQVLEERFSKAFCDERVKGIAIATRPDCIDEDIVKVLAKIKKRCPLWVELGLQTSNDKVAEKINRGYKSEVFVKSVELLSSYGIDTVAHIMIGLPEEGEKEAIETVEFLNKTKIKGVKIHSLYVLEDTVLGDWFKKGLYTPLSLEDYVKTTALCLSHLRPDIVIHRITGDAPKDKLLAPLWNTDKNLMIGGIIRFMRDNDLIQGCNYKNS